MLDKNWIIYLLGSIGYPIGHPYKIYEDNQVTIKRAMADRIAPQARPLDVLITSLHELHLRKIIDMVDTRSNMQLSDLNSKPHGGKSLRNIIGPSIGSRFYPSSESVHYKLIFLDHFHKLYYINFEKKKKSEIKMTKISNASNPTTKTRAARI